MEICAGEGAAAAETLGFCAIRSEVRRRWGGSVDSVLSKTAHVQAQPLIHLVVGLLLTHPCSCMLTSPEQHPDVLLSGNSYVSFTFVAKETMKYIRALSSVSL